MLVELLALVHRKPLSNTRGIASVGEKQEQKSYNLKIVQAGVVCISRKHTHALLKVQQSAYNGEATEPFMWSLSLELGGGWPF